MAFPNLERFTLEDIATRWGKPLDYVREYTRPGLLELCVEFQRKYPLPDPTGKVSRQLEIVSYVKREDLYAFEERFGIHVSHHENVKSQKLLMPDKETYSIPEAAKHLRCHESTVRRWIEKGKLAASGPKGTQRRIHRADLLAAKNPPE